METQKFKISTAQSTIDWIGRKVTGAHNGTIAIKEGTLFFNTERLAGGRFVIDMKSINILDVTDPATNAQFAGHLASDDFFNIEQYPEASFEITSTEPRHDNSYRISGLLTVKGIIHPVSFTAQVNLAKESVTATGTITIDRTKFGIRFRSGNFFKDLGDTLIYDDFDLHVSITAELVHQPAIF
ncbi:YceI family protein [Ohtaekwangia sp.]|uniref:YceI family protein n=1 Tax=Ohtaekwangia sp. TaxID=2066019 RepID=UPI002F952705